MTTLDNRQLRCVKSRLNILDPLVLGFVQTHLLAKGGGGGGVEFQEVE